MSRERVIVEIEDLEQALKLEETVKTGYCDPIAENLLVWIAVEEDLASSYGKLTEKYSQQETKDAMRELHNESKRNITKLHEILNSVEELGQARNRRRELIANLINSE